MTPFSLELVDTMLALMPDAAVVIDGEGIITSANEAVQQLFGYHRAELIGQRIEVLVPERFRAVHRGDRDAYIESPRPRPMGAGLELFGRRSDGTEIPVDISLASVELGDGVAVVAAIRSAAERRQAEATHARLAAIVESSADAIFTTTAQGVVESWNLGAQRILGYPSEVMLGAHVSQMVPDEASPALEDQMHAAMKGQPLDPHDTNWRTSDGHLLPVSVSVSPLRSTGGGFGGFSFMLRDISERKQTEEQLRLLAEESVRNARWHAVLAEAHLELLGGEPLETVLTLICERLCDLLGAKGAIAGIGRPPRVLASGGSVERQAMLRSSPELPNVGTIPRLLVPADLDPVLQSLLDDPFVLLVPIRSEGEPLGCLLCGLAEMPDAIDRAIAASMADSAGLGIELERARVDRDLLVIGDERERIARDLHDLVIQRLFASGLSLKSALPMVDDEHAVDRLSRVVDDLDETIREIRTTIFTLAPPMLASTGLRVELRKVVEDSRRMLGFEPTLRFEGLVDNAVSSEAVPHLMAVVVEALSNVARHARASDATVEVRSDGVDVRVVVFDDGVGIDLAQVARQSGLRNMLKRAQELGGSFDVSSREGGGTRLEWRVPVSRTA
jgi:PAS domain S-box-containing protein